MKSPALVRSPYPVRRGPRAPRRGARLRRVAGTARCVDVRRVQEATLADLVEHAQRHRVRARARLRPHPRATTTSCDAFPSATTTRFSPYIDRMRKGEQQPARPRVRALLRQLVGQLEPRQGRSSCPSPSARSATSSAPAPTRSCATCDWSGDAGLFSRLHARPLPADDDERRGAVARHVEPGADDDARCRRSRGPCYLPDDDVRRIADYDEKLGVIAERYLDYDVRAVTGTTCWFTLLFEKVLAAARARGRRARDGLARSGRTCASSSAAASRRRRTCPSSASSSGGTTSRSSTRTTRPRAASTPRQRLQRRARACSCSRTAARSSSSSRSRSAARPTPTRVPLWAVERDRPYSIVVTTVSGLYAYELGDIVRFPPTARSASSSWGASSGCLSVTQELTTHVEIERAVAARRPRRARARRSTSAPRPTSASMARRSRATSLFVEFQEGAAPRTWARSPPRSTTGSATRTASTASTATARSRFCPARRAARYAAARDASWKRSPGERPGQVPPHHRRHEERSCFGSTRHRRKASGSPVSQESS